MKHAATCALGAVAEGCNKHSAYSMTVVIQCGLHVFAKALPVHIWDVNNVVLQSGGTATLKFGTVLDVWGGDSGIITKVDL